MKKREDAEDEEEEEEEETRCRHSLCWKKAAAQWLPGNDQGEDTARACGDVEEVSCGNGRRFQWSRSRFAAGSERDRGENAWAFPSTANRPGHVGMHTRWSCRHSFLVLEGCADYVGQEQGHCREEPGEKFVQEAAALVTLQSEGERSLEAVAVPAHRTILSYAAQLNESRKQSL